MSQERLTVLACANADSSEKLYLLVIGKSRNPLCLKHIMTGEQFTSRLKGLDFQFSNHKILHVRG